MVILCALAVFFLFAMDVGVRPSLRVRPVRPANLVAFNRSAAYDHLVVVAGHAVTMTESLDGVDKYDNVWYLLDYQRNSDLPREFVAHVRAGVQAAAEDPRALLIFSGGQTRSDAGPRSEAQSYYFVADHFDWWGHRSSVAPRATTEEFARDSFENVLFSLCRFHELSSNYPRRVSVVSFDFKQKRFEELHAGTLKLADFRYVPMDPQSDKFDEEAALKGELATVNLFRRDPLGCGRTLSRKRRERDPFARIPPYGPSCAELKPALRHCDRHAFNSSHLPWVSK